MKTQRVRGGKGTYTLTIAVTQSIYIKKKSGRYIFFCSVFFQCECNSVAAGKYKL